ncbi:MAG TPA: hypothetical protein VF746_10915 [Longimicrobium sp.]|jgi:hypothetical protein
MRPLTIEARPWPEIAAFYRGIPWAGAMADLAERIAASEYAPGLFGATSMHTLLVAQTPEFERDAGVLRVEPVVESTEPPKLRLRFEFVEQPGVERRWTRECAPEEGFATFLRFLQLQRWFVEYRPAR